MIFGRNGRNISTLSSKTWNLEIVSFELISVVCCFPKTHKTHSDCHLVAAEQHLVHKMIDSVHEMGWDPGRQHSVLPSVLFTHMIDMKSVMIKVIHYCLIIVNWTDDDISPACNMYHQKWTHCSTLYNLLGSILEPHQLCVLSKYSLTDQDDVWRRLLCARGTFCWMGFRLPHGKGHFWTYRWGWALFACLVPTADECNWRM